MIPAATCYHRQEIWKISINIKIIVQTQKSMVLKETAGRRKPWETLAKNICSDTKCIFGAKSESAKPERKEVLFLRRRIIAKIGANDLIRCSVFTNILGKT